MLCLSTKYQVIIYFYNGAKPLGKMGRNIQKTWGETEMGRNLMESLISIPNKLRIDYTRFRCRNSKLPIEAGVYKNIEKR